MTFSSSSNRVRDRATGTVIGSTSDERLKKNIKPLGSILSKIKKLKAITHLWKDDEDTAEAKYGFIAQEVEKVFPELIDTSDQGYKSLDYPKMTVILTKAMQEQQKQIDAFKKKVDELSA